MEAVKQLWEVLAIIEAEDCDGGPMTVEIMDAGETIGLAISSLDEVMPTRLTRWQAVALARELLSAATR